MNLKRLKYFIGFPKIYGLIPTSYQVALSYEEQLFWLCNEMVEFQSEVQTALLNLQEQVQELIDSDFITPEQLQEELSLYLQLSGGTMSGDLDMNGHRIVNAIIEGDFGTTNYNDLENKPSLNLHTLVGNTTLDDINVFSKNDVLYKFTNVYNNLPFKTSEIYNVIDLEKNASYIPLKELKIFGHTERQILLPSNLHTFNDVYGTIILEISESNNPSLNHSVNVDLLSYHLRDFVKQDESVVRDEISGSGNLWYLTQRIGYIASYNNEFISTEYESSTGTLSVGAEVRYLLETPVVIPLESSICNSLQEFMNFETFGFSNTSIYGLTAVSSESSAPYIQVKYYLDLKTYLNELDISANYNDLENKPSINNVSLVGNKSLNDLGIASENDLNNLTTEFHDSLYSTTASGTSIQVSNALPISLDSFNIRGNFDSSTFKPVTGDFYFSIAETSSGTSRTYEIDLEDNYLALVNGTFDEFVYANETFYLRQKIGHIESYAGETISTDYISSTGSLTTGAEVYYVLETPEIKSISSDLQFQLQNIKENAKMFPSCTISSLLASVSPVLYISYYVNIANLIPSITYGTTDLTAGVSPLPTGSLYFTYE